MSERDLIAAGGFVVLFLLMLIRVPIGVAMGIVGVGGFGTLVAQSETAIRIVTWAGAAFLAAYGLIALRRAWKPGALKADRRGGTSLAKAVATCLSFTFLNPHVYLDTVVLLGSLSARYADASERTAYAGGAMIASAVWFGIFAIPVLLRVPEIPAAERRVRVGFFRSYAVLWGTLTKLWHGNRQVLMFLLASAVFRDGLAGVFTFGAIIAAQVFRFSSSEVLYFAVAANVVAGASTILAGRLDDRFGPKNVIMASLIGLVATGTVVLFINATLLALYVLGCHSFRHMIGGRLDCVSCSATTRVRHGL